MERVAVHRTSARLADGREIIFFDERPATRAVRDQRPLDELAAGSQLRWDPLSASWSVIAAARQDRTYKPPADQCPLCPSVDGRHTEVPAPDYDVVVFENRFPSLSQRPGGAEHRPPFLARDGFGRCEVVCFTSEHDVSFTGLEPDRVATVLAALIDRTGQLSALPGIEYVYCFENRGEEIGVTLSHPHGQIYAMPVVPPRMVQLATSYTDHHARTGRCAQCDALAAELAAQTRIVLTGEHWVAYVPFAARWPYEVRVVPRRHLPDLPALEPDERAELSQVYLEVLRRFDAVGAPSPMPYIASWQQAPVAVSRDAWHLAAEITTIRRAPGKLKYLAGVESGAALWINDIAPETAAARLRGDER